MTKKIEDNLTWEFILDHIDGGKAVLTSGSERFIISKSFLPKGVAEGGTLHISFSTKEAYDLSRNRSAKELLNEILNV